MIIQAKPQTHQKTCNNEKHREIMTLNSNSEFNLKYLSYKIKRSRFIQTTGWA